jgi:hypothetical protein
VLPPSAIATSESDEESKILLVEAANFRTRSQEADFSATTILVEGASYCSRPRLRSDRHTVGFKSAASAGSRGRALRICAAKR